MNIPFDIIDIIFTCFWSISILLILVTFIVSIIEKEKRASVISFFTFIAYTPLLTLSIFEIPYQNIIELSILSIFCLFTIILILPINNFKKIKDYSFKSKIDERDIMFSRVELSTSAENFNEYYNRNKEKRAIDDKFRKNPGLLKEGSKYYNKILFASANSSFKAVETYANAINSPVSRKQENIDPKLISSYIKHWTKQLGAVDCGITELKEYHKYTHTGRKGNYGNPVELDHKYAIAFTVEMDKDMISPAPAGSTVMESAYQYLNVGSIAMQLSFFLKELGHDALAHIDGNYQVICPLVAKDAGLGEIGRMGLLMTPKLGPRVRIAVLTTNIPLIVDKPSFEPSVIDFCNICKKCANTCPGNAISDKEQEKIGGDVRWQINQEACFNYWTICGTDCGRCMSVCPYSHPNNFLHNTIRFGLKNSMIFRRFALKMDDILYGRKPAPGKGLKWTKLKT